MNNTLNKLLTLSFVVVLGGCASNQPLTANTGDSPLADILRHGIPDITSSDVGMLDKLLRDIDVRTSEVYGTFASGHTFTLHSRDIVDTERRDQRYCQTITLVVTDKTVLENQAVCSTTGTHWAPSAYTSNIDARAVNGPTSLRTNTSVVEPVVANHADVDSFSGDKSLTEHASQQPESTYLQQQIGDKQMVVPRPRTHHKVLVTQKTKPHERFLPRAHTVSNGEE